MRVICRSCFLSLNSSSLQLKNGSRLDAATHRHTPTHTHTHTHSAIHSFIHTASRSHKHTSKNVHYSCTSVGAAPSLRRSDRSFVRSPTVTSVAITCTADVVRSPKVSNTQEVSRPSLLRTHSLVSPTKRSDVRYEHDTYGDVKSVRLHSDVT